MNTAPIKTIESRPGWPSWARWRAIDKDGTTVLYRRRPKPNEFGRWGWKTLGMLGKVHDYSIGPDRYRPYRNSAWKRSLRRVVSPKGKKP